MIYKTITKLFRVAVIFFIIGVCSCDLASTGDRFKVRCRITSPDTDVFIDTKYYYDFDESLTYEEFNVGTSWEDTDSIYLEDGETQAIKLECANRSGKAIIVTYEIYIDNDLVADYTTTINDKRSSGVATFGYN